MRCGPRRARKLAWRPASERKQPPHRLRQNRTPYHGYDNQELLDLLTNRVVVVVSRWIYGYSMTRCTTATEAEGRPAPKVW